MRHSPSEIMMLTSQGKPWWRRVFGGEEGRRMTVDNEDTERHHHRDPDIAREERQTLARHRLAVRLGIDPRLAEYLLELQERIEKLEDGQGLP
jgi:hypothetical protein